MSRDAIREFIVHERKREWTAGRVIAATLWVGITWIIFLPLALLCIGLGCVGIAFGATWIWEPPWMLEVGEILLEALGRTRGC